MSKKKMDDDYIQMARYKRQIQKLEPLNHQPKKKRGLGKASMSVQHIDKNERLDQEESSIQNQTELNQEEKKEQE